MSAEMKTNAGITGYTLHRTTKMIHNSAHDEY